MTKKRLNWVTRVVSLPSSHPARAVLENANPTAFAIDAPATEVANLLPVDLGLVEIPIPDLSDTKSPQKRAEFLLHTAAEIEHALMVQYLAVTFSLGSTPFEGNEPANAEQLVSGWRPLLLRTAREEMGHLMTVQNLLRLIGGRINLEREDFPFRTDLYPFPFTVEPLTPVSLAKYIAAEMPQVNTPSTELQEIIAMATAGAGMPVNRVGVLYAMLTAIFSRPEDIDTFKTSMDPWLSWAGVIHSLTADDFSESEQHLSDDDFLIGSEAFQASPDDWGGDPQVFIRTVSNREQALAALKEIALQGEGLPPGAGPPVDSHFQRFMLIRQNFPLHGEWTPARNVAVNPTLPKTGHQPTPNTITNERSQRWAKLFDLRYGLLLFALGHFLESEGPLYVDDGSQKGDRTPRGYLHRWVFNEMRRLHKLGRKLSQLPRFEDATNPARAGAPFTLPPTLALPSGEPARWKLHRDCFRESLQLIERMIGDGLGDKDDPFLKALLESDHESVSVAESQLTGASLPPQPTEFQKVVHILDEAVRGLPIRRHGAFWRNIDRDGFVATVPISGTPLLIVGDSASSNLIKVLRGELPGVARMPRARPMVPRSRIEFIREWIDRNCPDNDPPGAIGIQSEPDPINEPAP